MSTANKIFCVVVVAALILAFAGGLWYLQQPKTVIDTDTLLVTREGAITTVCDLVGDEQYHFRTVRVRRTDSPTEPHRAITTNTIEIEILPHGILKITDKTAGKVYEIGRKAALFAR